MRKWGKFSSAAAFEAAVEAILADHYPKALQTGEIGQTLGRFVYAWPPRCGHDDCTRPSHNDRASVLETHPGDIVRPVLQRLVRDGIAEQVLDAEGNAPRRLGYLWKWIPNAERPQRQAAQNETLARARAVQADLERRLGVGP